MIVCVIGGGSGLGAAIAALLSRPGMEMAAVGVEAPVERFPALPAGCDLMREVRILAAQQRPYAGWAGVKLAKRGGVVVQGGGRTGRRPRERRDRRGR